MENQNKKIANLQLSFSENISNLDKEILTLYWEIDDLEFINSAKSIRKKFDITQSELSKKYRQAEMSLYIFCEHCNSYEKNTATSQSNFKEEIRKTKYYKSFKCNNCFEEEEITRRQEAEQKQKEFYEKLVLAVEQKNWNNLNNFEKGVLKKNLEVGFENLKKHYGKILGKDRFITLIRAIEKIEKQNLAVVDRDYRNYISNVRHLESLHQISDEIIISKEDSESTVTHNTETGELKFKLTIDNSRFHPDSPLYSGVITFKKRIILEPNTEYVFAQWERSNNNLYLTMIPKSEFEKLPEQKSISRFPKHIKKGIQYFLNNMGKNL